ncbi:MAG: TIGR03936 family radical SAM-associated protein [Elusimicrobia bacterium]|nr:TIGR03936 family radical SAM-associated protein [Elusimicrobiota bacterium]
MKTIIKIRVKYAKQDPLRFLSHLEVVSAIRQGVRRANLPVCFSEGFSPQLKIAFGPPLSVGYTSTCEIFDMEMVSRVIPEEVKKSLLLSMPSSLGILAVTSVPVAAKSMELSMNVAKYSVKWLTTSENMIPVRIKDFFELKELLVERLTDKNKREIDVRPLVIDIKNIDGKIEMLVRFGPRKTVKPDMIIQKIFNLNDSERSALIINRDELFYETEDGRLIKQ